MSTILCPETEQLIAAQIPDLIRIRRELHANPQIGFEETFASERVQKELGAAGVPFQAGVAETGVVGWIEPPGAGRDCDAIALRADMDALPMQERTGLPYASQTPGRMHACGHDGHTAILIGAVRVLARLRDRLPRPVKFLFQPAEEGRGGGAKMVQDGALEERVGGRKVGIIFGLHGWSGLAVGTVSTRIGPIMAGADRFDIVVHGKGGHGAAPHRTADPILAAAHVVTALQSIVARNVDPTSNAVVTVGTLHAGTAINIIPDSARIEGTVRTLDDDVAKTVHDRLTAIAQQVAGGLGCSADVKIVRYYPLTANDPGATECFFRVARDVLGEPAVTTWQKPEMGSEDFSFYARQVPACFFFLGIRPPDRAECPGPHSSNFDFNDDAIITGVRLFVALALSACETKR